MSVLLRHVASALILLAGSSVAGAQSQRNIEWGLRNLLPESSLIVALDTAGKLAVFQKPSILAITGNRVTLREGAFVFLDVEIKPAQSGLNQIFILTGLMDAWVELRTTPPATEDYSRKMVINGESIEIKARVLRTKESTTVELREVLQTGAPRSGVESGRR